MWCGLRPYVEWEGISSALTCSYLYIIKTRKKPFLSKYFTIFSKELDDRIQTRPWQSIWWVENSHKALLFHLGIFLSRLLFHFDFFNWIKGLSQFFEFFVTIFGSSWNSWLSPTRGLVPFQGSSFSTIGISSPSFIFSSASIYLKASNQCLFSPTFPTWVMFIWVCALFCYLFFSLSTSLNGFHSF